MTAHSLQPLSPLEQDHLRKTIGLRCTRARKGLGLSQRALARIMGHSGSWVRGIEGGDQYAPAYLIYVLATARGVSAAWFYGEECDTVAEVAQEIVQAVREELTRG